MKTNPPHLHTTTIAALLEATPPGGVIRLNAISDAIGRDVRECRYFIDSARKLVQKEHLASFINIRRVGYRRLRPGEVAVKVGGERRKHYRKTASRTRDTISVAIRAAQRFGNGLSPEEERRATAELTFCGFIESAARDKTIEGFVAAPPPPSLAPTEAIMRVIGYRKSKHP